MTVACQLDLIEACCMFEKPFRAVLPTTQRSLAWALARRARRLSNSFLLKRYCGHGEGAYLLASCLSAKYFLPKESQNIRVLLSDAGRFELRLMGCESVGSIDTAYFCKAFGHGEGAGWIYREWVRWFHSMVAEATSDNDIG